MAGLREGRAEVEAKRTEINRCVELAVELSRAQAEPLESAPFVGHLKRVFETELERALRDRMRLLERQHDLLLWTNETSSASRWVEGQENALREAQFGEESSRTCHVLLVLIQIVEA